MRRRCCTHRAPGRATLPRHEQRGAHRTVDFAAARKRLGDVIAGFTTHAFDQDASNRSAKGETEKQWQMRLTIRTEQMVPIAEIARHNLAQFPEFMALQMPARSANGGAFIASADA